MSHINELVEIIRNNPGCEVRVDNNNWHILKGDPIPREYDDWDDDQQIEWDESQEIASSYEGPYELNSSFDHGGNLYGGDVLAALAIIAGIKVYGV